MFEGVPVLILGPVAGLAADRLPRRRLMVGADVFRCVAALGLVVVTDAVRCRLRRGLRIVRRSGSVQPRRRVALPDVIGEHDVVEANSAMWTTAVVSQIALAPLAGLLISRFGVGVAFAFDAATFAASALLLVGLHAGRTPADPAVRGWAGALDGIRTVRSNPLLARLAVV